MNLKRWMTAIVAALALAACSGSTVGAPVARVDNVILTQQALDQRIAEVQAAAQPGQQRPADQALERQFVNQFVQENLILSLARQRGIAIDDKEVDDLIGQFRTNLQGQSGQTLDQAVRGELGLPGEGSSEFRQFASSLVAQRKLAETLVTSDTVRQDLTTQMMARSNEKIDQVHVAHILVQTEDEAKKVLDRLAQGEQFEALAKELSKDPGSAEKGGDLGWIQRGQTVPEFDQAVFTDLKPGEITKTAIQTQYGYHIIKVIGHEQRALMSEEEARQAIEQGIGQELQTRRGQALQQLIAGEHAKAKEEERLVEPEYAEATPEPAPGQAQPAPEQAQPTSQP
ncbi:MAG: peptidylprolyl isomerase [Roseiflexaceae bacterium]